MPNVRIFGVSINPGPFTIKEHVRMLPHNVDIVTDRQ